MQNLIPGGASSKKATSCSISTLVRRQYNLWIIVIPLPSPTSPSSSVLIIEMRHNLWETYMLSTLCPELCILFWKKLNFCKVLTWSTFLCDKKTQLAKDKQIKNKKKEGNKPKKKKVLEWVKDTLGPMNLMNSNVTLTVHIKKKRRQNKIEQQL